jgi:hypothetical protein
MKYMNAIEIEERGNQIVKNTENLVSMAETHEDFFKFIQ